jgi:dGTPase
MKGTDTGIAATALRPYAADPTASRGRRIPEPAPQYRSEFQRDRDRIIHASAFRRLEYKTQVFVNHEGDLFRTRLTHTLEVAQIARTIARVLGLNEDLTEAITLAHDLGHTPFGHAGQEALNDCMRPYGGFEHNLQSLRVVDELEERYAEFAGLNLTFETREGILKHCSRRNAEQLGELGQRFLASTQPGLEAQLANLADEIAYNSHDVDDGLRAGFLSIEQLRETALLGTLFSQVERDHPRLPRRRVTYQVVRHMISLQVADLIETSRAAIAAARPPDIAAVRAHAKPLIRFSEAMREQHTELKRFLFKNLYRHHRVYRMNVKSKRIIRALFEAFFADPLLMPPQQQAATAALESAAGEAGRARSVADYVAGMTDRYAIDEHAKLFDPHRLT